MEKRENDRLIGVWRHPQGGWEIKYQKDGKKHSEYRQDEAEARLRAAFWKESLETPGEQDEEYVHPVTYWDLMLRRFAEMLVANPSDRDLSAACRAIASAAQAAMRTAKYIPAPKQNAAPDGPPVAGDVSKMTTEEMEALLK
jgi:hypothetical protein